MDAAFVAGGLSHHRLYHVNDCPIDHSSGRRSPSDNELVTGSYRIVADIRHNAKTVVFCYIIGKIIITFAAFRLINTIPLIPNRTVPIFNIKILGNKVSSPIGIVGISHTHGSPRRLCYKAIVLCLGSSSRIAEFIQNNDLVIYHIHAIQIAQLRAVNIYGHIIGKAGQIVTVVLRRSNYDLHLIGDSGLKAAVNSASLNIGPSNTLHHIISRISGCNLRIGRFSALRFLQIIEHYAGNRRLLTDKGVTHLIGCCTAIVDMERGRLPVDGHRSIIAVIMLE